MATRSIKSITPWKLDSAPIGSCSGMAVRPSLASSCWMTLAGLAPVRSILLMKAMRGTPYRFIWRSTVIDCDCTPATAQSTRTAPSRTRNDRSTSTVKSTCPGVSIMLILMSFQWTVVAAEVIVIPRSFSSSMWSITAPSPLTSLMEWVRPL